MAQRGTTREATRGTPTRRVTPGASHRFVAATEQRDGMAPVVSIMGEVDLATALALEQTLFGAVEDGKGEVIVDLTGCSFLDSRGVTALIATRARLERSNRRLVLVLSNPSVLRIFQITRCDRLFDIYPSVAWADVAHRDPVRSRPARAA